MRLYIDSSQLSDPDHGLQDVDQSLDLLLFLVIITHSEFLDPLEDFFDEVLSILLTLKHHLSVVFLVVRQDLLLLLSSWVDFVLVQDILCIHIEVQVDEECCGSALNLITNIEGDFPHHIDLI